MANAPPHRGQLQQLPMCRALTDPEADLILEISEESRVAQGETLFKEGDPGDALYVILEGEVRVTKGSKNGQQQELARIGSGGVLGEMSLISGDGRRSASVTASAPTRLLKIPTAGFSRLIQGSNVAALKMVHHLAQEMGHRLQLMNEKLVGMLDGGKRKEELADFQQILSNWSF
jgi:CRP/FNR family transcriptional regulator, cyclic AMP receptor protein